MFAEVVYTGVAGTQTYTVPFEFLQQDHVFALVNNVAKSITADFTINPAGTQLTFLVGTTILNGDTIKVFRVTPKATEDRVVDFQDGSTVREVDLDNSALQMLFITQEAFDTAAKALQLAADATDVWDALTKRLTNLGAPIGSADAVRLADLQAAMLLEGNLPVVTGGDDNSMLAVVAGAWAIRTAAQLRTSLGLGTAAVQNVGTANGNVVQVGASGYPAIGGSLIDLTANPIQDKLHAMPVMRVAFNDTAIINNVSATWNTDTSGTLGRLDLAVASATTHDALPSFSSDAATDLFTLGVGVYDIEINVFIANTGGAATGNIDVMLTGATGTSAKTFAAQTLGAKPAGATHSEGMCLRATLIGLNVASPTTFALKARHNAGAGTVVCYGDGTELIIRRTGVPGGP